MANKDLERVLAEDANFPGLGRALARLEVTQRRARITCRRLARGYPLSSLPSTKRPCLASGPDHSAPEPCPRRVPECHDAPTRNHRQVASHPWHSTATVTSRHPMESGAEVIGKPTGLVAEESQELNGIACCWVHDNVGIQRQGGHDLNASDVLTGEANLADDPKALVYVGDHDVALGENHGG